MPATRTRPLEHTGDIGFELSAPDLETLFDAARRVLLAELMASPPEGNHRGDRDEAVLQLEAPAADRLLVRWLDELLYLVQTRQRVPVGARLRVVPPALDGAAWQLQAQLTTAPLDPQAHGWRGEVKGATYHDLQLARGRAGWRARVILDV